MGKLILNEQTVISFKNHLVEEEKSPLTVEKYLRDVKAFLNWKNNKEITRKDAVLYKKQLEEVYSPTSVNSMLAGLNSFFEFCGMPQMKVKPLKIQKSLFAEADRELSQAEYKRLITAAKNTKNERLSLVMQVICSTGIRVSELRFITVEAVEAGRAEVSSKGKRRTVFLRPEMKQSLMRYAKKQGIISDCIFLSKKGNPLNRHKVWADMKSLCMAADVAPEKVFPHNLRHLFARTFYSIDKDLGRLADILGHSSINTTRIYTMECGKEHIRLLRKMPLLI